MRIVIGSAGRRVYLVRWFQQALRAAGIEGEVIVMENDPNAPSVAVADRFVRMPRYETQQYRQRLLTALAELQPRLFFSLNDYELTALATGLADEIRAMGIIVPTLTAVKHRGCADKYATWQMLTGMGLKTPKTALVSDTIGVEQVLSEGSDVIVKDRWGSGSSGLQRLSRHEFKYWLLQTAHDPSTLVVQPAIEGHEYGVDIVCPLEGGVVAGVLARRKLAMRGGETSVCQTIDPAEFFDLAETLAAALGPQGLIDVDIMRTASGENYVLDINPRFGGGYPFNHLAGADIPGYYIASLSGHTNPTPWCQYRHGYTAVKHEDVVGFESLAQHPIPNQPHTPELHL
ncbi:MAG TPA: ATP-grasp domain-containing protein [Candidatus Yaniella excrementigallinarum]|nr:ATP-grasp domain-containing protein [Candidatus Yaniella excrementigallinarum]